MKSLTIVSHGQEVAERQTKTDATQKQMYDTSHILPALPLIASLAMTLTFAPPAAVASPVAGNTKWAVVLRKFFDHYEEPFSVQDAERFFSESGIGTGAMFDYWRDMSYGALDLTGTQVFGWYQMPYMVHQYVNLGGPHPGGRAEKHKACRDEAAKNVDLSGFFGVIVVWNHDDGQFWGSYKQVALSPGSLTPSAAGHEMGHGYGLQHSWAYNPTMQYGDPYDSMSYATFGNVFPAPMFSNNDGKASGPGLNAAYRHMLGWIPAARIWPSAPYTHIVTLAGLETPSSDGYLLAPVPIGLTSRYYAVEFRPKIFWDRAILQAAVLVREVHGDHTYLEKGNTGLAGLQPGDYYSNATNNVLVAVIDIDDASYTATVEIGPYPNGLTSTQSTLTPPVNSQQWTNVDTQVQLNTTASSGGNSISYAGQGAQRIPPTTIAGTSASFTVRSEGITTIVYVGTANDGHPDFPRKLFVRIDKTAPQSSAFVSEANGLYTIRLTAWDTPSDSGVQHIAYETYGTHRLSGRVSSGGFITVPATGRTTVFYWAVDNADNWEGPQRITFEPLPQLSTTSLTFASAVGVTSAPQITTLKNVGRNPLVIGSIASGTYLFTIQSKVSGSCAGSLAPGAECRIAVVFTPLQAVSYSDTLFISTDTSSLTVALSGTGLVASLDFTPALLSFPATQVRDISKPQVASVRNTGPISLVLNSIDAGVGSDFVVQQNGCDPMPRALQPGESCDVLVVFRPRNGGVRKGAVTITDNTPGGKSVLPLDGVGVLSAGVTFNPAALHFGVQSINTTSPPLTLVVSNSGTEDLYLFRISLGGASASNLEVIGGSCSEASTARPVILVPERTCDVVLRFTPAALGGPACRLGGVHTLGRPAERAAIWPERRRFRCECESDGFGVY